MNKFFTRIAGGCLGLAMAVAAGVAITNGSKPVSANAASGTHTIGWGVDGPDETYSATSGTVTFAAGHTASFSCAKNSSTTNPAYNSNNNDLRLYYSSTGDGGSITFTLNEVTITGFVLTASTSPSVEYTADSGTATSVSASDKVYTVTGISASSSLKIQNVNTSNTQLRIKSIEFTYEYSASAVKLTAPSPSYDDLNKAVTWSNVENASKYQVSVDGESNYADATSPYDVSGLSTGSSHTVYVKAIGDGTNFSDSDAGSVEFTPTAAKALESISVSDYVSTFYVNQTFTFGGTVTAHFDDESSADVTSYATISDPDMSTTGKKTVTVEYTYLTTTKQTTYEITVLANPTFEKITSADDLVAGWQYVIGNANGSIFMSSTQNSNNRGIIAGTAENDVVTFVSGMEVFNLGGSAGAWTFYATKSDPNGYIYAASSSSNYLRTQSENDENGQWEITFTDGTPSVVAQGTNSRNTLRYNSSSSMFSCYASGQDDVSLWKLIDTSESIVISQSSLSGMKGMPDDTVYITANNFTPTDIEVSYSTAGIATVTKGEISDGTIPLNVAMNSVGSTTATITVKGGSEDYEVSLDITVNQKPKTLTLVNSAISNDEIYVKNGSTKQISFTATDTDDQDYAIDYSGITAVSSDSSIVRLTGSTNMVLNGDAVGDATVTCTIKATESWEAPISKTLTVHVIDDYNTSVNTITYIDDAAVEQGNTLNVASHISAKTANTYFGTTAEISDSELLFSYTNDRDSAVAASSFVYEVTDGTLNPGDTENRTIYVFTTFDESYSGSFTAVVTVANRPVTGLLVDEVAKANGDEINLEIARNTSYDLNEHVTVNPANATESHEINYVIEEGSEYISLVDGVISTGHVSGDTVALVSATPAALPDFSISFYITITQESLTFTADLPSSWSEATSLEAGDRVAIVYEDGSMQLSGISSSIGTCVDYSEAGNPNSSYVYTVGEGSVTDSYTFYDGSNYLALTSDANSLHTSNSVSGNSSWTFTSDGLFNVAYSTRELQYNTGSPRFACYKSTQKDVAIYKLTGGATEVTANAALVSVLNDNMTYVNGNYRLDNVCDITGEIPLTQSDWTALGNNFTSAIISDNKLAYARADVNGNQVEQFLAAYDYVVRTYGESYDFLGRVASGKIVLTGSQNNLFNFNGDNDNRAMLTVIAVSVVSVTLLGGLILRKRKEVR